MKNKILVLLLAFVLLLSACSTPSKPAEGETPKENTTTTPQEQKPQEKKKGMDEYEKTADGFFITDYFTYITNLPKTDRTTKIQVKDVEGMGFPMSLQEYMNKYKKVKIDRQYVRDDNGGEPLVDTSIEGLLKTFYEKYKETEVSIDAVLADDPQSPLFSATQPLFKFFDIDKEPNTKNYEILLMSEDFGELTQAEIKEMIDGFGKPDRIFLKDVVGRQKNFVDQSFLLVYDYGDYYFDLKVVANTRFDEQENTLFLFSASQCTPEVFEQLLSSSYKDYIELK
ncbi:hypothetical protein [Guggenheimella bovis]